MNIKIVLAIIAITFAMTMVTVPSVGSGFAEQGVCTNSACTSFSPEQTNDCAGSAVCVNEATLK